MSDIKELEKKNDELLAKILEQLQDINATIKSINDSMKEAQDEKLKKEFEEGTPYQEERI